MPVVEFGHGVKCLASVSAIRCAFSAGVYLKVSVEGSFNGGMGVNCLLKRLVAFQMELSAVSKFSRKLVQLLLLLSLR